MLINCVSFSQTTVSESCIDVDSASINILRNEMVALIFGECYVKEGLKQRRDLMSFSLQNNELRSTEN